MSVRHDTDFSYIALELCDYSLETWLKQKEVKDLTEEDWRMKSVHLIGDLLHGLEHMHANDMLHRDLKVGLTYVQFLTFISKHYFTLPVCTVCEHSISSLLGIQPV